MGKWVSFVSHGFHAFNSSMTSRYQGAFTVDQERNYNSPLDFVVLQFPQDLISVAEWDHGNFNSTTSGKPKFPNFSVVFLQEIRKTKWSSGSPEVMNLTETATWSTSCRTMAQDLLDCLRFSGVWKLTGICLERTSLVAIWLIPTFIILPVIFLLEQKKPSTSRILDSTVYSKAIKVVEYAVNWEYTDPCFCTVYDTLCYFLLTLLRWHRNCSLSPLVSSVPCLLSPEVKQYKFNDQFLFSGECYSYHNLCMYLLLSGIHYSQQFTTEQGTISHQTNIKLELLDSSIA